LRLSTSTVKFARSGVLTFKGEGMDWARTVAKKHPKYVYGRRHGMLLHEVLIMELQWWQLGDNGRYWVRMKSPRIHFQTRCGVFFFGTDPESKYARQRVAKAAVCELPKPDAVLCGRCQGKEPIFAKGCKAKPGGPTRQEARARLGCAVEVT